MTDKNENIRKKLDCMGESGNLVRKIMKLWRRIINKQIEEYGITAPQLELMGAITFLQEEGTETTQIALALEIDSDPMTTSTIIRNLLKKNLVTRKESTTDTRARIVDLTDEGYDILAKATSKIISLHNEITTDELDNFLVMKHLTILYNNLLNLDNNDKSINKV